VCVSEVVPFRTREAYRGSEGVHPVILNNFSRLGSAFLSLMQGFTERRGGMVGISFVCGEVQGSDLYTELQIFLQFTPLAD